MCGYSPSPRRGRGDRGGGGGAVIRPNRTRGSRLQLLVPRWVTTGNIVLLPDSLLRTGRLQRAHLGDQLCQQGLVADLIEENHDLVPLVALYRTLAKGGVTDARP